MANFTIKRHDTAPSLTATLAVNGAALDLTNATTVEVIMKGRKAIGAVMINGLCTVTSAVLGQVSYRWVAGDTDVSDTYDVEFEITWNDGRVQTLPNDSYDTVIIMDDLENA